MSRRRIGWAAAALVLLVVAGAFAAYRLELFGGVDVEAGELAPVEDTAPEQPKRKPRLASWPMFRFDEHRTGLNPRARARPPFRVVWKKPNLGLNEAPPAIDRGIIVGVSYTKTRSEVYGRNARTGRLLWRHRLREGENFAGGPAIARGRAYVPAHDGNLRVFNARTGKLIWKFKARPNEGPPAISKGVLYFGDGFGGVGEMYAINTRTRRVLWRFRADDHISSGAALTRSTVYFGSYGGSVYAVNRANGRLRWRARATDAFGRGVGFYSTPALAGRRLIIGGLDGKVYSFNARTGEQQWVHSGQDGQVYSSAAVDRQNAYIGGLGGTFSAIDLDTGEARWTTRIGANIGAPTIIRGIVYVSTTDSERTYGLSTRSGRRVWSFRDGEYTPVLADGRDLWLVGKSDIYRLVGKRQGRTGRSGAARRRGTSGR